MSFLQDEASIRPYLRAFNRLGSTDTTTPVSVSEGRQRPRPTASDDEPFICPSRSPAASPKPNNNIPTLVSSESEVAHLSFPTPPTDDHEEITSSELQPEPPKWSVVYHHEVERALDLHLAHAFTYDPSVYCIHMSPDGQRLAVGHLDVGKTYLHELHTGSNIWFGSELLV